MTVESLPPSPTNNQKPTMKQLLILTLLLILPHSVLGQQARKQERSATPFANAEFKRAKILQPFGKFVWADANIYLKDASLCFMENDTIKKAFVDKVVAVQFDSATYRKVEDGQMGLVVAEKNYNSLVRVRTIDMKQYTEEHDGTQNAAYLDFDGIGRMESTFIDLNNAPFLEEGFPVKDKYYFIVKGKCVVANESHIEREVSKQHMDGFKKLMRDQWWSWRDEASLKMLLEFLP